MNQVNLVDFLTVIALMAAAWSTLCRVRLMMHGVTRIEVFLAHFCIFLGLAAALLWPAYGRLSLGAGILAFFLLGTHRWRNGAPEGTRKPLQDA
jgi:hypothetical protein